jgi:glycosyltransferase involved in cell wall biosynthesis
LTPGRRAGARVAILVPSNLKKTDGNTVRAARVIPVIAASFRSTVLTGRKPGEQETKAFGSVPMQQFFELDKDAFVNPIKLLILNLRLLKILIKGRFDAVYAQGPFLLPSLWAASVFAGTKFVYEAHALAFRERAQVSRLQPLLLLPTELLIARLASGVVALSGETRRFYDRYAKRVFFIPVFVDTRTYRPAAHRDHNGSKNLGLVGPFEGIFNGGQVEFLLKNVGGFSSAIRFVLIGRQERDLDKSRFSELGFLPDEEYPKALADLDALIVPVSVATYGPKNKIIEGMACGLPVFSSPKGVVGLDFARPGENIFVFPLDEMVEQINELMFEDEALARVSANARRTVEEHYGGEACGEEIVDAIHEVMALD